MKDLIINLFEKNRIIDLVVIQEQSGSRADQCFESLVRNESFKMALAETLLDSLSETDESEFLSKIKEIYRDLEDSRENLLNFNCVLPFLLTEFENIHLL